MNGFSVSVAGLERRRPGCASPSPAVRLTQHLPRVPLYPLISHRFSPCALVQACDFFERPFVANSPCHRRSSDGAYSWCATSTFMHIFLESRE